MKTKNLIAVAALVPAALLLSACDDTKNAVTQDKASTNSQLLRYQTNQPIPQFDWSQYRQTLIDVESAQAHSVATTTFFFNLGVREPVQVCNSIGLPVPSTSQLTSPDQVVGLGGNNGAVVAQQEPNGAYTGQSTATYVICVRENGTKYFVHAEENAHTVTGPAHWDAVKGIVLDGDSTVKVNTK